MQTTVHHGTALDDFGLSIRGQLVDFRSGARVEAVDQVTRDAIEAAQAPVEWDDDVQQDDGAIVADEAPRRRGRPPKSA